MANLPFTLRQLDVFSTLCKSMSFRTCADDLNVSQAAVSSQIKALETQLGVPLFLRPPGRPPRLTGEGKAFLSEVQECEKALNRLASHRRAIPCAAEQTRFRILIGLGLLERHIRPKLDDFIAGHPSIECEFVTHYPRSAPGNEVEDGHFDFALYHIAAGGEVPQGLATLATVTSGLLGHETFVAGRDLPLSAEEASDLPMILPPEDSDGRRTLLAGLAKCGVVPRNVVGQTQYFDVMARMVERGTGVASLPMTILAKEARAQIAMLFPVTEWLLVWYRKPDLRGATIDALEDFLKAVILADPSYTRIEPGKLAGTLA